MEEWTEAWYVTTRVAIDTVNAFLCYTVDILVTHPETPM